MTLGIIQVVSGGQTGADRGALNAAIELGIAHGGWCPRGRKAEDGAIPARYTLAEATSAWYPDRTERNVRDADATLVFTYGKPTGGSAMTVRYARQNGRPVMHVDLTDPQDARIVRAISAWLRSLVPPSENGPRPGKAQRADRTEPRARALGQYGKRTVRGRKGRQEVIAGGLSRMTNPVALSGLNEQTNRHTQALWPGLVPVAPSGLLNPLPRSRSFVLNVAGSRESRAPGIQARVRRIITKLLLLLGNPKRTKQKKQARKKEMP